LGEQNGRIFRNDPRSHFIDYSTGLDAGAATVRIANDHAGFLSTAGYPGDPVVALIQSNLGTHRSTAKRFSEQTGPVTGLDQRRGLPP